MGIPMLFIVGWRGEPGIKDEPQHVFQGKITCELFDTLSVPYRVIDKDTTDTELDEILAEAEGTLKQGDQFAVIVKKGTFDKAESFVWENGSSMIREEVLGHILQICPAMQWSYRPPAKYPENCMSRARRYTETTTIFL